MKTIMAYLEPDAALPAVLGTSLTIARQFSSHIDAIHLQNSEPELIAAGADGFVAAAPELLAGLAQEAKDRAARARGEFAAFCKEHGLSDTASPTSPVSAVFRLIAATGTNSLGHWGRVADLIVVASAQEDQPHTHAAALETALFESGRPVMIAPPKNLATLGQNIVIAWNGSTETARTVAFAMPFLKAAQTITILTTEPGSVPGPPAQDVATYLARHGLTASCQHVAANNGKAGEMILEECACLQADLLIKGAFTQSRLRQMIFGGATSHIIANAALPVFMAH